MYRIVLACSGIPAHAGPSGARDISEEFTHRTWHKNVSCSWDGSLLILQDDNDFDSNGLALMDEFSDAISACIKDAGDGDINVVSVTILGSLPSVVTADGQPLEHDRAIEIEILGTAKQLIAGQLGVIAASRELSRFRHDVEPRIAEVLLTFAGIDSETDTLPIGGVRKEWSREALERKDTEIRDAERIYRDSAMSAAAELTRLLDVPF